MNLPVIIGIVAAFVVVLAIVLVLILKDDKKPKNVYIFGCSRAGKTQLLWTLHDSYKHYCCYDGGNDQYTEIQVGRKIERVFAFSTEPRYHTKAFNSIKDPRGVIFVIDCETALSKIKDNAKLLYEVFSVPEIIKNRVPVLIFCAKSDLPNTAPIFIIRKELEKEFESIRLNRQQDVPNFVFLGNKKKYFNFSQLRRNKIMFTAGSAKNKSIKNVLYFLEKMVK